MKASPLDVHSVRFVGVLIESRPPIDGKPWPSPFDFDGVTFHQEVVINKIKNGAAPAHAYSIRFKNSINNVR